MDSKSSRSISQKSPIEDHSGFAPDSGDKLLDECHDDRPFKCNHCSKGFRQKGHLVYHLHTHSITCEFKCDECKEEFMTPAKLLRHQRLVHKLAGQTVDINREFFVEGKGVKKTFKCKMCGKFFAHLSTARTHSWMHSGTKPFKCKYCNKGFRQSGHLICHVIEFHSVSSQPRICTLCGKNFKTDMALRKHMTDEHGEQNSQNEEKDVDNETDSSSSHCKMREENAGSLRLNDQENSALLSASTSVGSVEGDEDNTRKMPEKRSEATADESEFDSHTWYVSKHSPEQQASGDTQTSQEVLYQLKESVSMPPDKEMNASNESGIFCKEQDDTEEYQMRSSQSGCRLQDNVLTRDQGHDVIDRYDFETDEKTQNVEGTVNLRQENGVTFSYSPKLLADKRHLTVKVIGNKRCYECTLCHKTFVHAQTATNHSLIHAGIKPFRCNVCNQRFRQRAHVVYHMHKHTNSKRFTCEFCDKKFVTATKLRRHAREVHGLDKESIKRMLALQNDMFTFKEKSSVASNDPDTFMGQESPKEGRYFDTNAPIVKNIKADRMYSASSESSSHDGLENDVSLASNPKDCTNPTMRNTVIEQSNTSNSYLQIPFVESRAKLGNTGSRSVASSRKRTINLHYEELGSDEENIGELGRPEIFGNSLQANSLQSNQNTGVDCVPSMAGNSHGSEQIEAKPTGSDFCSTANVSGTESKQVERSQNASPENARRSKNGLESHSRSNEKLSESQSTGKRVEKRFADNSKSQVVTSGVNRAESRHLCRACCEELDGAISQETRCIVCGIEIHEQTQENTSEGEKTPNTQSSRRASKREEIYGTESLYPCPFCTKIFRRKTDISVHLEIHNKPLSYCCVLCNVSLHTIESFRSHAKQHMVESEDDARKEVASLSNDIVNSIEAVNIEGCDFEVHMKEQGEHIYCKLCQKDFTHWLLAKSHAVQHNFDHGNGN